MKRIRINVGDKSSVDKAIKEIDVYTHDFVAKVNLFVRRLGAVGIATVQSRSAGQNFETVFNIKTLGVGVLSGTLEVRGEELLFYEFGTGVHYNDRPSPHPDGARLGMLIGEYGRKQGQNDYWYYDGEKQYGIKAQMPVYMSYIEIVSNFERIAKEVFSV